MSIAYVPSIGELVPIERVGAIVRGVERVAKVLKCSPLIFKLKLIDLGSFGKSREHVLGWTLDDSDSGSRADLYSH